jgi:heavy metal translocating P-type ATPase
MERIGLKLGGLSCAACASTVDRAISHVPGVVEKSSVDEPNIDLKLLIGAIVSVLLIIGSLLMMLNRELGWVPSWIQHPAIQLILATPVQLWCGGSFLVGAWNAASHRRSNLNTLVAIGTGAAYLYSIVGTFAPQIISQPHHPHLYYQTSVGIITLILLGKQLEQRAKKQPKSAIKTLINPQQQGARMIDGSAEILQLVAQVQADRVPILRLADRVTGYFVPIAILMAIGTSSLWLILTGSLSMAMITGVGVLIIACPCALGLATSTAIMVGTGKGAERGIIIKSGASLELLNRVKTIVFDQTCLFTIGKTIVTDFIPIVDNYHGNELDILQLAASLAYHSEHPLATAIVDRAKERGISLKPVEQFQAIIGSGAQGAIDGKFIQVGSSEWIDSLNLNTVLQAANYQILTNYQQQWEAAGKTVVWIAIDSEIAGIIGISDAIKPSAVATISRLKKLGLEVVLLTGDNLPNAQRLAQTLGIDRVFAQIKPQGKAEIIRTLQSQYIGKHRSIVAMVGDGINDAPALAQADVGIAMGTGTDIAIAASDVTIISPDLQSIITAIKLSRSTLTNIKQNLFFAFIYNLIGIPIAAGLFYPLFGWLLNPAIAAGAMAFSSVSVLANALRLRRFKG